MSGFPSPKRSVCVTSLLLTTCTVSRIKAWAPSLRGVVSLDMNGRSLLAADIFTAPCCTPAQSEGPLHKLQASTQARVGGLEDQAWELGLSEVFFSPISQMHLKCTPYKDFKGPPRPPGFEHWHEAVWGLEGNLPAP